MELLIDTADLKSIQECQQYFPIAGVTCNPSIIKKCAPENFFEHMRSVRSIIGMEETLHIQIIAKTSEDQIREAHQIFESVDDQVYIKVPTDWQGLRTIRILKQEGHHVTATAVYDLMQAYMALEAGADYIAPYVNRISSIGANPYELIRHLSQRIDHDQYSCRIVAASFHSIQQIRESLNAGSQAVTVSPDLYKNVLTNPCIEKAISDFNHDWETVYGAGAGISGKK